VPSLADNDAVRSKLLHAPTTHPPTTDGTQKPVAMGSHVQPCAPVNRSTAVSAGIRLGYSARPSGSITPLVAAVKYALPTCCCPPRTTATARGSLATVAATPTRDRPVRWLSPRCVNH
jgi:hypothetical protein